MNAIRPATFPVGQAPAPRPAWIGPCGTDQVRSAFGPAAAAAPSAAAGEAAAQQAAAAQLADATAQAAAEGRARGEAEGRAVFEDAVRKLDEVLTGLVELRLSAFAELEGQLVDLALCVSEAIIERELTVDRDYTLRIVRHAVELVASGDEVEISVAPQMHQLVAERLEAIAGEVPRAGGLLVKADESIEAGCVVETRMAQVDATVAARLKNVAERLHQAGEGGA
jgi:flagellar biosynthesis/type III secretory pathway protein FliH